MYLLFVVAAEPPPLSLFCRSLGHWFSTIRALCPRGSKRKAAIVTRLVHITLKDALEQNRMKEFMAQYKGIKASGGETGKRVKRAADTPRPQRRKASRAR